MTIGDMIVKRLKPDINTKFHIDFDWWKRQNRNFRIHLRSHLCPECQESYTTHRDTEEIDWIDPDTAEVRRVDGLWQALRTCCSRKPNYMTDSTPLTDAVFRVFLANDNTPLSAIELSEAIGRKTPETILTTLARRKVYLGIRPVTGDQKAPVARGGTGNTLIKAEEEGHQ